MTDPTQILFSFPVVRSKKVTCAFDGGAITSDAGVLLLAQAERRLGIMDRLAAWIPDGRDPARVTHSLADILRARVLAIAAGYEDADDLDALRHDPAFMMALGKTPGEAVGMASQPTISRWENAPDLPQPAQQDRRTPARRRRDRRADRRGDVDASRAPRPAAGHGRLHQPRRQYGESRRDRPRRLCLGHHRVASRFKPISSDKTNAAANPPTAGTNHAG